MVFFSDSIIYVCSEGKTATQRKSENPTFVIPNRHCIIKRDVSPYMLHKAEHLVTKNVTIKHIWLKYILLCSAAELIFATFF